MNFSSELTNWLCMSLTGAALHAHFAQAHASTDCRLCGQPPGELNDAMPCLHWLVHPYCKLNRAKAVFEAFAVVEAVRYVLIWTRAQTRRQAPQHMRCDSKDGAAEILIGLRHRSWRFSLEGQHGALFEYKSARTNSGFAIPVDLYLGEAAALRHLAQCDDGGHGAGNLSNASGGPVS